MRKERRRKQPACWGSLLTPYHGWVLILSLCAAKEQHCHRCALALACCLYSRCLWSGGSLVVLSRGCTLDQFHHFDPDLRQVAITDVILLLERKGHALGEDKITACVVPLTPTLHTSACCGVDVGVGCAGLSLPC